MGPVDRKVTVSTMTKLEDERQLPADFYDYYEMVDQTMYLNKSFVSTRYRLKPGKYLVMPTTYYPRQEASYIFRVYITTFDKNFDRSKSNKDSLYIIAGKANQRGSEGGGSVSSFRKDHGVSQQNSMNLNISLSSVQKIDPDIKAGIVVFNGDRSNTEYSTEGNRNSELERQSSSIVHISDADQRDSDDEGGGENRSSPRESEQNNQFPEQSNDQQLQAPEQQSQQVDQQQLSNAPPNSDYVITIRTAKTRSEYFKQAHQLNADNEEYGE